MRVDDYLRKDLRSKSLERRNVFEKSRIEQRHPATPQHLKYCPSASLPSSRIANPIFGFKLINSWFSLFCNSLLFSIFDSWKSINPMVQASDETLPFSTWVQHFPTLKKLVWFRNKMMSGTVFYVVAFNADFSVFSIFFKQENVLKENPCPNSASLRMIPQRPHLPETWTREPT